MNVDLIVMEYLDATILEQNSKALIHGVNVKTIHS